jgi:hypothetical protein
MLRTAGVYARSHEDGSVEACVVVLQNRAITAHVTFCREGPAVSAKDFETLRTETAEMLETSEPQVAGLWQLSPVVFGVRGGIRAASTGLRAEGVVLAAFGAFGLEVAIVERDALRAKNPQARRVSDAVEATVAGIRNVPDCVCAKPAAAVAILAADASR